MLEADVKMTKEIKPKENAKRGDSIWFFIFVVLPFISIIYSFGEFLYKTV
ncbi:hypothetical protein R4Z10_19445 [Niallia sp. XMNu-256]